MVISSSVPSLGPELLFLIQEEINVKEIQRDTAVTKGEGLILLLDTNITPELKEEGFVRDLVRAVQGERKNAGLNPHDSITLTISASNEVQKLIKKYERELKSVLQASAIRLGDVSGEKQKIGDFMVAVSVLKV